MLPRRERVAGAVAELRGGPPLQPRRGQVRGSADRYVSPASLFGLFCGWDIGYSEAAMEAVSNECPLLLFSAAELCRS